MLIVVLLAIFVPVFSSLSHSPVDSGHEENHYEVNLTQADVLINQTITMKRGDLVEINISITDTNTSLTVIVDILNDSGRLWGLYIEPLNQYYKAKAADSFKNFDKLMDHVTIYTVVHLTLDPRKYVLALHDSHAHQEPDTTFNLLVVKGHIGQETNILPMTTTTSQQSVPSFTFFTGFIVISFLSIIRRKI